MDITCHKIEETTIVPFIVFILSGNFVETFKMGESIKTIKGKYTIADVAYLPRHCWTILFVTEVYEKEPS